MGCMERDSKDQMLRVGMDRGLLIVDEEGRMQGRGGYLHRREECINKFVRSKAKELRSLKHKASQEEKLQLAEAIRTRLASNAALE
jgi:predicted RNA-binding protein YlxR (DUF448 family)